MSYRQLSMIDYLPSMSNIRHWSVFGQGVSK